MKKNRENVLNSKNNYNQVAIIILFDTESCSKEKKSFFLLTREIKKRDSMII